MCFISDIEYVLNLDNQYKFSEQFVKILLQEENSNNIMSTISGLKRYLANGLKNLNKSGENIFSKKFYECKGIEALSSLQLKCNNKSLSKQINDILIKYFDRFYNNDGFIENSIKI